MSLFTKLFQFVILMSAKYSIDESHGLTHSMDVLRFANNIFNSELKNATNSLKSKLAALNILC